MKRNAGWIGIGLALALLTSTAQAAPLGDVSHDGYIAMAGTIFNTTNDYFLAGDHHAPDVIPPGMVVWGYAFLKFDNLPGAPVAEAHLNLKSQSQSGTTWDTPEDVPITLHAYAVTDDVATITGANAEAFRDTHLAAIADSALVSGGDGYYSWDITAIVNGWITSGNNYGLVLAGDENSQTVARFDSGDTVAGVVPGLDTVALPEPASVSVFLLGAVALIRRRRR